MINEVDMKRWTLDSVYWWLDHGADPSLFIVREEEGREVARLPADRATDAVNAHLIERSPRLLRCVLQIERHIHPNRFPTYLPSDLDKEIAELVSPFKSPNL